MALSRAAMSGLAYSRPISKNKLETPLEDEPLPRAISPTVREERLVLFGRADRI